MDGWMDGWLFGYTLGVMDGNDWTGLDGLAGDFLLFIVSVL